MSVIPFSRGGVNQSGGEILPRLPSRAPELPADEAELARRLASGDEDALTAVAEWLWHPLAAYAYRIVEDSDTATDIVQEALVRLWEARRRERPKSLRAYLFHITRNLALDHVKTGRTRLRLLRERGESPLGRQAAPDEVLEREDVYRRVHGAIQELPLRRREVFTLVYLRGLSYAEVGEVMGISRKTVENQMTAALSQLRRVLRPLMEERFNRKNEWKTKSYSAP